MPSAAQLLQSLPIDSPLRGIVQMLTQDEQVADDELLIRVARIAAAAEIEADKARSALVLADRRFEATFTQSPVGIAHVAPDGAFLLVNDRFALITGHSIAALMQHGFQQITHPDDLASDMAHVQRLLSGAADRYLMEKRYLRPDGSIVWVNLTVALIRNAAGAPDFFVSVIEDLSEIKRARSDAMRDSLTGLLNRRGFLDRAARDIKRAMRTKQTVSLVFLDLDGFKGLNDAQGHSAGDLCLIAIARMIEAVTRPGDVLARIGGDEFTVLLPNLSAESALDVTERLRAAIADYGLTERSPLSGSLGIVSLVPERDTVAEHLIALADQAMLRAKRDGKNCVRLAAA